MSNLSWHLVRVLEERGLAPLGLHLFEHQPGAPRVRATFVEAHVARAKFLEYGWAREPRYVNVPTMDEHDVTIYERFLRKWDLAPEKLVDFVLALEPVQLKPIKSQKRSLEYEIFTEYEAEPVAYALACRLLEAAEALCPPDFFLLELQREYARRSNDL